MSSTCIDSNQQWLAFGTSRFTALPSARVAPGGSRSFALAGVYQHRPITVTAASPHISGRDIPLLNHVVDAQTIIHGGLGGNFDLGLALRTVPHQRGTGVGAVRSRIGSRLERSAIRDPIAGLGYALPEVSLGGVRHASKLRLDISLPLGDADRFAGEAGLVARPSAVSELSWRSITLGAQLGARLRRSATLGDVRYGNQLFGTLGLAVETFPELLFVAGELTAAPSLQSQPRTATGQRASFIPAEWGATVTAHWTPAYAVAFSGGGGIPVSSQSTASGDGGGREHFVGLGTPRVRLLLMLRIEQVH